MQVIQSDIGGSYCIADHTTRFAAMTLIQKFQSGKVNWFYIFHSIASYSGGNLSGQNNVVTTVNQYCPGDTVRFGQSSSFFANPVGFGAKHTS